VAEFRLKRQPNSPQSRQFINSRKREQLFGGAKRGGKSVSIGIKICLLAYLIPGSRIGLFRKDFTDLQDTTLKELLLTIPDELYDRSYGNGTGHNKGDRCIRLLTRIPGVSSEIMYRGLGSEVDIEKAKGINMSAMFIDEPSEISFETYKMLNAQLTWKVFSNFDENGSAVMDGTPPYMTCLGCNPEPGWVKERFIDPETRLPDEEMDFIPSLPRNNPDLPAGWEDQLRKSYDQEWVDKYLDGSWMVTEGTVFKMLRPEIHDLMYPLMKYSEDDQFKLIQKYLLDCNMVAGLDHGETGVVASQAVGADPWENLCAFEEYYEEDKLISEHCKGLVQLYESYTPEGMDWKTRFRHVLIDPSTSQRTLQAGNQRQAIADAYRNGGALGGENPDFALPVIPAWNALELGIEHMKQLMTVKPGHCHPITGKPEFPCIGKDGIPTGEWGAPNFYLVKRLCRKTWKELSELRKKLTPAGRIVYLGSDHGIDPLRYVANSRPKPAELTNRDKSKLPLQDQFMLRALGKWQAQWDKAADDAAGVGSGSYF